MRTLGPRLDRRWRVLAAVLLASAPIALALAIALPATNNAARSDVIASRETLARAAAAAADNYVERSIAQLATISTRSVIRTPGTSEQVTAELAPLVRADPNWVTFGLSAADGWNISSFTSAPHTVNISDRDYFQGALATGKAAIGSVILARSLNAKTIVIALPITFSDGRRGVFSGALSLAQIGAQLGDVVAGSGMTITLFDGHGTAFIGPGVTADQVGDVSADPLLPRISAGDTGAVVRTRNGTEEIVAFANAPTAHWGVMLSQPAAMAFGPSDTQLRTAAAVSALAVLVAVGLAWLLGGWLAREGEAVEAERRRLTDIFDHLPARMALLRGPDLRYELANPASLEGVRPPADVLGRTFAELVPDPRFLELVKEVYASGEPRLVSETPANTIAADGSPVTRYFNAAIIPLRDAKGEVDAVVYHAVDVTEQVRARTALEQARLEGANALERAETAARVREDFLSIATHELRTPVTSISGYAQLALKALAGGRTERLRPALETVVRQSERLAVLVTQLLDASRIAGGRLSVEPERTDVSVLVTSAVDAARLRSEAHRWVADIVPALQATIDPIRFEQVLTNLFDNAVRYSPSGGTINVRLDVDGPLLRLAVSDEGLGIAPERIAHVFERFYRGHEDQGLGGLGLGLYIAREIVELHGGTIDVRSTLGRGTTFIVRVPITSALPVTDPPPGPAAVHRPDHELAGRVLVIDDDPDILRLVRDILRTNGATVFTATNGEEALKLLERVDPQLILLDKLMPVMDGTAFAMAYRELPRRAPIVAVCAARDAAEWAGRIGAIAYVTKPFDLDRLVATVAQHLRGDAVAR